MVRPTYFDVEYSINPWMDPKKPTFTDLAVAQWEWLCDLLTELGHRVELLGPRAGLPDMMFAANGAAVFGLNAVSDGRHVVLPQAATRLAGQLREHGFEPIGADLSELLKAGGSVKCCTLELRAG
jgi:N-dimethylarginine dimethylaminohydrolase